MQASLDFQEARGVDDLISTFPRRFVDFIAASEPYAHVYREIEAKFPEALPMVDELLRSIQEKYFSDEAP
jgi:hypothetical protein